MTETVVVPGPRDVRGRLDTPGADRCVVACPPHPQFGGNRNDRRLTAVGDALGERSIAYLRFDYGPWAHGDGEGQDAINAVKWADGRFRSVGLFGYSFGGSIALLAAVETGVACVSVLAPGGRLDEDLDPVDALEALDMPVQVIYGERDSTANWEHVVVRARAIGMTVEPMGADHHFVGQDGKVADLVAAFVDEHLERPPG